MTLIIELRLTILRLRLAYWRAAAHHMGPLHKDFPLALHMQRWLQDRIRILQTPQQSNVYQR